MKVDSLGASRQSLEDGLTRNSRKAHRTYSNIIYHYPCDPEVTSRTLRQCSGIWMKKKDGKIWFYHSFCQMPEHCSDVLDVIMSLPSHVGSDVGMQLHIGWTPFLGSRIPLLASWLEALKWGMPTGDPHQEIWQPYIRSWSLLCLL